MSTSATPVTDQAPTSAKQTSRIEAREKLRADLGPIAAVPLTRLVAVETRKQVDTVAGRWFLIAIGAVIAITLGIMMSVGGGAHGFIGYFSGTSTPMGILLPVLGIMTATSEWTQRTAMATFTLEPRRGRVVLAKVLSTLLIAVAAIVLAVALAAAANALAIGLRDAPADWELSWGILLGGSLATILSLFMGLGFGLALLNTPLAIVAYLALPQVFSALGLLSWFEDIAAWIDTNVTFAPLLMEQTPTGEDWAKIAVSSLVWAGVPLAVGTWRVLRREVK